MELPRAKTAGELFTTAQNHDIILTASSHLAEALNARIERPRFGKLAYTPRSYIYSQDQNADTADRHDIFLRAVSETDLPWKQVSHLLHQTIDAWKHTGRHDAILQYDRFDTDTVRTLVQIVRSMDTIYRRIEATTISNDQDIAVIAPYQFNSLQHSMLPDTYSTVPIFADEKHNLDRFKLFSSCSAIIRSVMQKIQQDDPRDIAIVVDPGSQYDRVLRARLDSASIPYTSSTAIGEQQDLMNFLSLLQYSLEPRIRVKQIQPLLQRHDRALPEKHSEKFLDTLDHEEAHTLIDLLQQIADSTVQEALELYKKHFGPVANATQLLDGTGLLEQQVSAATLTRLEYYLDTFDTGIEQNGDGVLLTAPRNVSHIDRPVVFYLGMDTSWTVDIQDRPWINPEQQEERHARNFHALVQSGDQRFYLVQDTVMNEPVTPCLYFNDAGDIERFSNHSDGRKYTAPGNEGDGFTRQMLDIERTTVSMLSTSSLDRLVHCPRDYFFDQLVEEHEQPYFVRGSLFHDFAEFYVAHPDIVQEQGITTFVDHMISRMEPFLDEPALQKERTIFRLGLRTIKDYLDSQEITGGQVDGYIDLPVFGNEFADRFDHPINTGATEMWFQDADLGMRGVVDLILSPTHLVDYKSSKQRSARSIVEQSNPELVEDEPSFQALMYLTYHRQQVPARPLRFTFFHFLDTIEDTIRGDAAVEDAFTTITYYPETFDDALCQDSLFQKLIGDVAKSNKRRKTLEKLGQDAFTSFLRGRTIPNQYDQDALLESDFASDFIDHAVDEIGDYKYVHTGCRKTLKRMVRIRKENFFREDLDRFEDFIQQQIDRLNTWRCSRFPVGDTDLEHTDHRDLILTGDGRD